MCTCVLGQDVSDSACDHECYIQAGFAEEVITVAASIVLILFSIQFTEDGFFKF